MDPEKAVYTKKIGESIQGNYEMQNGEKQKKSLIMMGMKEVEERIKSRKKTEHINKKK